MHLILTNDKTDWAEFTSQPIAMVQDKATQKISLTQEKNVNDAYLSQHNLVLLGRFPPLYPENLGGNEFIRAHGARFPYIVGEMANGIATAQMVINAAKVGLFACFGAAGLDVASVEKNLHHIKRELGEHVECWGSNLINSPQDPSLESALVDLYLRLGIKRVSASAYLTLSPHIVRYAATGLKRDGKGEIIRKNFVLAKLSRPEVAKHFMSPPPADMLNHLVFNKSISQSEAELAAALPIALDITVESDSAGHTDNRPLSALFTTIQQQALAMERHYAYPSAFRLGAAGGLGTPGSLAAAFALGSSYVLTGSINAASIESGLSLEAKKMLASACISDVMMAPAADMFELGVKLQVLKRGSLFALRAAKLYELYKNYSSIEAIPTLEKEKIEKEIFRASLDKIWESTQNYFIKRDPQQLIRAEKDAKHKMALLFRWYLGQSSHWAILGDSARRIDYQLWCGPAMGAFNAWVAGTFLEKLENRSVVEIGLNLLQGAAAITRMHAMRSLGVDVPNRFFNFVPRELKGHLHRVEEKFA